MTRITVWIDWISTLCAKMGKVIVLVGGTGILLSMAIGVFSRGAAAAGFCVAGGGKPLSADLVHIYRRKCGTA